LAPCLHGVLCIVFLLLSAEMKSWVIGRNADPTDNPAQINKHLLKGFLRETLSSIAVETEFISTKIPLCA